MKFVLNSIAEDLVDYITRIQESEERTLKYVVVTESEFKELSKELGLVAPGIDFSEAAVLGTYMGVELVNHRYYRKDKMKDSRL